MPVPVPVPAPSPSLQGGDGMRYTSHQSEMLTTPMSRESSHHSHPTTDSQSSSLFPESTRATRHEAPTHFASFFASSTPHRNLNLPCPSGPSGPYLPTRSKVKKNTTA
jgi:hypothetical protein